MRRRTGRRFIISFLSRLARRNRPLDSSVSVRRIRRGRLNEMRMLSFWRDLIRARRWSTELVGRCRRLLGWWWSRSLRGQKVSCRRCLVGNSRTDFCTFRSIITTTFPPPLHSRLVQPIHSTNRTIHPLPPSTFHQWIIINFIDK